MATKKIIVYCLAAGVIALCVFSLVSFSKDNIVFNLLGPAKQFVKKEARLHLFGQEQTSINKVLVRVFYCLPRGEGNFVIEDWPKVLNEAAKELSDFYQLQFAYDMEMDFKIYPEVVPLGQSAGYFTDLVKQDLSKELSQPHSPAQSIRSLITEVSNKTNNEKPWGLTSKEIDGFYAVNLFVLGIEMKPLEVEGMKILGLNDESNSSLVFAAGFVDSAFKDFYGSVVGHEIGHALGVAWFADDSSGRVESCTVMGGGSTRKLKDNYLKEEIKEKMISRYE